MAVDIYAIKLGKRVKDEEPDDSTTDLVNVFSYEFEPIKHLTMFEEGYYEDLDESDYVHFSYGLYNMFRKNICKLALGEDIEYVWDNIEDYIGKPFIEFINFADNEGSFDYVVAEKLYNDFKEYLPKVEQEFDKIDIEKYKKYMEILKQAVDYKGIVYYT